MSTALLAACRHGVTGACIGLLILLPHGVTTLHAQEADRPPPVRVKSPFLDQLRGIEIGRLRLRPSFREEITFDDNIFLNDAGEGEGREADLIINTRPGIGASLGFNVLQIDASYVGQYRLYTIHPEQSTEGFEGDVDFDIQIADLLDIDGDFNAERGNRWFVEVSNDFSGKSDPLDDLIESDRVARLNDRFSLRTGYELSRKAEIAAFYRLNWFEVIENDFDRLDSLTQEVGVDYRHAIDPRLDVVGEIFYGHAMFFDSDLNDSRYVQGSAGLEGQLSRRASFSLHLGYQHREDLGNGNSTDGSDADEWIGRGALRYEIGPDTQAQLEFERSVQLATASNHKTTTIGRMLLTHHFTPKITGVARAEVQFEEPSRGGDSIRYRAGLRFDYRLTDWMTFDLDYLFQLNESEQPGRDFYNNRVTLGMNLQF